MSSQHFNKGIVWGKVGEVKFGKSKKGTFSQGEEDFYGEHKFPTAKPIVMEVKPCKK